MKKIKFTVSFLVLTIFIFLGYATDSSPDARGYYGSCGFDNYHISVKCDGTISIDRGRNNYLEGKWVSVDGGIKVSGIRYYDKEYNGIWKFAPRNVDTGTDFLIDPEGNRNCKSYLRLDCNGDGIPDTR